MSPVSRERLPEVAPEKPFAFPSIQKRALDNGLRVWTIELPYLPILTLLVLVPIGSAADGGQPGLASLTADMLDEGSPTRSALDVHDALARLGAQLETEVTSDATLLILTTLSKYVRPALELLGEILRRPAFRPDEFERVRALRLGRLLQLQKLPSAVADHAFIERLYAGHPYGHLPLGTQAALQSVPLDESRIFYERAYRPSGVTLIAAGDLPSEEVGRHVHDVLGDWNSTNDEPFRMPIDVAPQAPPGRIAFLDRPASAQSEIRIGQIGVARSTPDYHALLVLNTVLGGQFVSRLNLKLREEKGYTYGARTSFDFRKSRGPFVLQVAVQTNVTADALQDSLTELGEICSSRPPSSDEVMLAKASLTRGYAKNFESAEQIARAAAQIALHELPDNHFERFVPQISAVDAASARAVALRHLDPAGMLTVIVGDHTKVAPMLGRLRLGQPTVIQT